MKYTVYILSFSFAAVLIFVAFDYNNQQGKLVDETFAQKIELVCAEPEIPVGTLINQTDAFHKNLLASLFAISAQVKAQIEESEALMELESKCKVENCTSSCQTARSCSRGKCTSYCIVNACVGEACPKTDIANRFTAVQRHYENVRNASVSPDVDTSVHNLITKKVQNPFNSCPPDCVPETMRDHILLMLRKVRIALKSCVTPQNEQTPESEPFQRLDTPISCQEAKFKKLLNDTQQQCATNNFFCCSLRVVK